MKALTMFAIRLGFAALSFLAYQAAQAATVTLAWDPSPTAQVTYNLYISTGTGAFTFVANTPQMTYTMNYDNTKTNRWYVTARNSTGVESVPSNTVQVNPATLPPPVFGLSFEAEAGTIVAPFYVNGTVIQQDSQTDVTTSGKASYVFNVVNAGSYTLSMLLSAPNEGANSFYVNVDAEPTDPANVWNIPVTTGFQARTVAMPFDSTNAYTFTLSAGNHTLIVRGREAGTLLDRITFTPISVPPTGNLAMSKPTLNGTSFISGQTVTGTAYVTNKTSAPFQIMSGVITARFSGSNTPYNFTPAVAAQTLAVNGVLTVTASWIVPAGAPAGTAWTAFVAIQGSDGVWINGPTTPFTVTTPVVLAVSKPTLNGSTFAVGSTITASASVTNNTGAPLAISDGVLTARQPGANNTTGPFDDFSPVLVAQTLAVNAVVTLTATWVVRASAPLGTGWTAHFAVRSAGVWTDGPTTPFTVTSAVPNPPTNLRIN